MEQSVRELAFKLWQIRALHNSKNTPEENWFDAENILRNKYLKPGIKVLYGGDEFEFLRFNEDKTVLLSSNTKVISAPIDEVVVIDV
jgi:hypothetical protein